MESNDQSTHFFKYPLFLKLSLSIYVFLALCSVGYLSSVLHLVDMSLLYERLFSLGYGYFIATSFIVAQIGIGNLLFRLPFLRDLKLKGLTYLLFSLGGGFYISYCLLMILALLNWLNGPGVLIYLLPAVFSIYLGYKSIKKVILSYHKKINLSPNKKKINKRIVIIGILIIIWIIPYFIQTLLPNTDWDGASYHLPLAKRFLEGKIFEVDFSFSHYDLPGAIHLVYSLFFFLIAETAIIPFNFLSSLLVILAVYSLTAKFWNKKAALWAAVICTAVNLLWEVALTPRIDSFQSLYFLLAVYSFLLWIQNKNKMSIIIITGMTLGISLGIKYSSIILLILLFPFILFTSLKKYKNNKKIITVSLLICTLTCAIPSGFWYSRNIITTGNPVYPLLTGRLSPNNKGKRVCIDSFLDSQDHKMPSDRNIKTELEYLYESNPIFKESLEVKNPKNIFNLPNILINPDKYQRNPYHEINIFLLAFILLPLFSRKKELIWLYGISIIFYVIIGSRTRLIRYALPVFPLFSIGAGIIISHVRSKILIIALSAALCLNLLYFNYFEWREALYMQPKDYIFKEKSRIDWLTEVGYNLRLIDTPHFIKYINDMVDKGIMNRKDKIFMVGECKGNLLKCKYLPDHGGYPYRWLGELIETNIQYQKIKTNFREKNISYIALNKAFFKTMLNVYPQKRKLINFALYHLSKFLRQYTEIIYDEKGIILAKLKNNK